MKKAYDYLNDFLKDSTNLDKFLKNDTELVAEDTKVNSSIFSRKYQKANQKAYVEAGEIEFRTDKNNHIVYKQYGNYYIPFSIRRSTEENFKMIAEGIDKISLNNYLSISDSIDITDSEEFSLDLDEKFNFITNPALIMDDIAKALKELPKINNEGNENQFHYNVIDKHTKALVSGYYNPEECFGSFIFQVTDSMNQVIENILISAKDDGAYPEAEFIYARKEYNVEKFLLCKFRTYLPDDGTDWVRSIKALYLLRILNLFRVAVMVPLKIKSHYKVNVSTTLELSMLNKIIGTQVDGKDKNILTKFPVLVRKDETQQEEFTTNELHKLSAIDDKEMGIVYNSGEVISDKFGKLMDGCESYPELDLSSDDIKKICNYYNRNYIKPNTYIDFTEILNKQRFGLNFKMKLFEDSNQMVYVTSELDKNSNQLIIYLYFTIRNYRFMVVSAFNNPKYFMAMDTRCFGKSELFVEFDKYVDLVPSRIDLLNLLPEGFDESSKIFAVNLLFISLYVMIANRPEKICPATKTLTNTRKVRENRKYVEKTDVVVKHIIAYKPTIMEKIKSNKSSGFRTEVQYVVENWDRVGHTRTYKSGKTIWIEPTNCHRHLELTNKQIKVKL